MSVSVLVAQSCMTLSVHGIPPGKITQVVVQPLKNWRYTCWAPFLPTHSEGREELAVLAPGMAVAPTFISIRVTWRGLLEDLVRPHPRNF